MDKKPDVEKEELEQELCPECGLPKRPEHWDLAQEEIADRKKYCSCEKP